MRVAFWQDRLVLSVAGLICFSLAVFLLLLPVYRSAQLRTRNDIVARSLTPVPADTSLLALVGKVDPRPGLSLALYYAPEKTQPTGIVSVHAVLGQDDMPNHWLVVFRYDITCAICRDVLAASVHSSGDLSVEHVYYLTEPLGGDGTPVPMDGFLNQFTGRPARTELVLNGNIDGVTGATKSSEGLVIGLNLARTWLLANVGQTCCRQERP